MANDDFNEDWLRTQRWDLPESLPSLLRLFAGSERATGKPAVKAIQHLMSLPAWNAAPEKLKKEAEAWLAEQNAKGAGARALSQLMNRKGER